jgi:hypothetical protein
MTELLPKQEVVEGTGPYVVVQLEKGI